MLQISTYSPYNPPSSTYSLYGQTPQEDCPDIDLLDSILSKDIEINCCIDKKTNRKLLSCSGENLYSFLHLVTSVPESTDTTALAQALNYLINGLDSQVITDAADFKKKYEALYGFDLTKTPHLIGDHPLCICHQEHYDTSAIEPPKVKEKTLEFYIEIHHTPYKVTCGWPVETDPPEFKQETLPPLQEDLFS